MSPALIPALFFTVALLLTNAYFLLGSVPRLILKHDTALDSRFMCDFFNTYYIAAIFVASAAAVSYAFAGKLVFAGGGAALALLALFLRWRVIPQTDALRAQIQLSAADAIRRFRRAHMSAIAINLAQLVLIVCSLLAFSVL